MSKQVWLTVLMLVCFGPVHTFAIRGRGAKGSSASPGYYDKTTATIGATKHQHREMAKRGLKASKAEKACENALEDMSDTYYSCDCISSKEDSDKATLLCEDTTCTYCNVDVAVCGNPSTAQVYDKDGGLYSTSDMFVYTKGFSDTISITSTDCSSENDKEELLSCNSCVASVSDVACKHCEMNYCENGSQYPSFDCSNVEAGAIFDLCDRNNVAIPQGSLFEPMGTDVSSFYACFPTTAMPTMAPTIRPTTSSPTSTMRPTPTPSSASPTVAHTLSMSPGPTSTTESATTGSWPTEEPTTSSTMDLATTSSATEESSTYFSTTSGGVFISRMGAQNALILGLLLGLTSCIMIS